MAKKDIKKLKAQANRLPELAEKLEDQKALKIGRLLLKHAENDFRNFDFETFRKQAEL